MSQQEFRPDSKKQKQQAESQDDEKTYTQSYSQYRTSDMPKRDHPSDYSGTIPTYSYQAQNPAESGQQQSQFRQTSNTQQRTQYDPRQQAGTQQQTFSDTIEKLKKTFTGQHNNAAQNQNWNWQQSVPPYMRPQRQGLNWGAILLITGLLLCVVPIMLKLLFVLFVILFTIGIGVLILIGCAILSYKFYFKKRWQRNRWWHW
jgi:Flp pilus assembly protein TadB